MKYEFRIRKKGVRDRKGSVRLRGESFKAFIYRITVTTSRGKAIKKALKNSRSRSGTGIKTMTPRSRGRVKISLNQATRYSLFP